MISTYDIENGRYTVTLTLNDGSQEVIEEVNEFKVYRTRIYYWKSVRHQGTYHNGKPYDYMRQGWSFRSMIDVTDISAKCVLVLRNNP